MSGEAGNELEVVHHHPIGLGLPIPVCDLSLGLIEGEAPKGQDRLSHVEASETACEKRIKVTPYSIPRFGINLNPSERVGFLRSIVFIGIWSFGCQVV
jgi:hypothetical protein